MSSRRHVPAVVALAACVACSGGDNKVSFQIGLSLDTGLYSQCLSCDRPGNCPLDCPGQVGVYVLAADVDAATPGGEQVLDSRCITFPFQAARSLTDLVGTELLGGQVFTDNLMQDRKIAVEIAVFTSPTTEPCPRVTIDPATGLPSSDHEIPWYFGRSEANTLDEALASIRVPLGCVSNVSCPEEPKATRFVAHLKDLNTLVLPDAQVLGNLVVRVAGSVVLFGSSEPLHAQMSVGSILDQTGTPPDVEWSRTFTEVIPVDPQCVGTIVGLVGVGGTASTVSCEGQGSPTASDIDAQAYLIDKATLDRILAALGLAAFPDDGLLVGKVVDATGNPIEGATVRPAGAGSTAVVTYFNVDEISGDWTASTLATGKNGYFAVHEATLTEVPWVTDSSARCCEPFTALAPGVAGTSPTNVGLIDGVVMATVIQVAP